MLTGYRSSEVAKVSRASDRSKFLRMPLSNSPKRRVAVTIHVKSA